MKRTRFVLSLVDLLENCDFCKVANAFLQLTICCCDKKQREENEKNKMKQQKNVCIFLLHWMYNTVFTTMIKLFLNVYCWWYVFCSKIKILISSWARWIISKTRCLTFIKASMIPVTLIVRLRYVNIWFESWRLNQLALSFFRRDKNSIISSRKLCTSKNL